MCFCSKSCSKIYRHPVCVVHPDCQIAGTTANWGKHPHQGRRDAQLPPPWMESLECTPKRQIQGSSHFFRGLPIRRRLRADPTERPENGWICACRGSSRGRRGGGSEEEGRGPKGVAARKPKRMLPHKGNFPEPDPPGIPKSGAVASQRADCTPSAGCPIVVPPAPVGAARERRAPWSPGDFFDYRAWPSHVTDAPGMFGRAPGAHGPATPLRGGAMAKEHGQLCSRLVLGIGMGNPRKCTGSKAAAPAHLGGTPVRWVLPNAPSRWCPCARRLSRSTTPGGGFGRSGRAEHVWAMAAAHVRLTRLGGLARALESDKPLFRRPCRGAPSPAQATAIAPSAS